MRGLSIVEEKIVKRKPRAAKTEEQKRKPRAAKAKVVKKPTKNIKPTKTIEKQKKLKITRSNIPPEINIGTAGHVDEGKSTLIQLLTGKFPDEHSEELKRGITIRLGYADADIMKCNSCDEPDCWTVYDECEKCGTKTEVARKVSFVDAPGHEILMQVMLSGAALMDGALMLIAANNEVPQAQTREHLAALEALGIQKIVVIQNKVDLVTSEQAKQNYMDIKSFLKGTIAENAPIIPMSALHGANLDVLLSAIQYFIPTPDRKVDEPMRMMVARSFDINRPGTKPSKLKGGVLGGSLITGKLNVGDEVVILPGLKKKKGKDTKFIPVKTKVESIQVGSMGSVDEAQPGGLLALATKIDPAMARSDNLAVNIISAVGAEPPVVNKILLKVNLFKEVVGTDTRDTVKPVINGETLLLTVGTATTVGLVEKIEKKGRIALTLRPQIAMNPRSKIAISRRFQKRWRLIGYGEVDEFNELEINISS